MAKQGSLSRKLVPLCGLRCLTSTRVEHFMHISAMGQDFPHDCGFQSFMWLTARAADSEFDPADWSRAIRMRCNFVLAVIGRDDHFRPRDWLLGSGSEVQIALAGVLREHAVPEAKVIERANMLISQLGEAKLHEGARIHGSFSNRFATITSRSCRLFWKMSFKLRSESVRVQLLQPGANLTSARKASRHLN